MTRAAIETLEDFFDWTDAGLGRKRIRCPACGAAFELRLMDDILEAACPGCGRGPFFERARAIEAAAGADEVARVLVRLGVLAEEEVAAAAEARDPSVPASPGDETSGLVGAARALGLFSKSLYLAVEPGERGPVFRARPLRDLVDPEELREAVEIERREGTPVGEVIAGIALNDQKEILLAAAGDATGADLDAVEPPREVLALLPPGEAASRLAIPLALEPIPGAAPREAARLVVAVRDPLDWSEIDGLKLMVGCDVRAVAAPEDALFRALERLYPDAEAAGPSGPRPEELAAIEAEEAALAAAATGEPRGGVVPPGARPEEAEGNEEDEDAFFGEGAGPDEPPGVRTLNILLLQAAEERAEQLVIEPLDDAYRVRLRRGGRLREAGRLPPLAAEAAIERAMILAGMDLSARARPQTGSMPLTIGGDALEVRVATAPGALGQALALVIREAQFRLLSLDAFALVPGDARELKSILALPPGLTIIAAPPGEGRTTLLYALLRESDRRREHVVTLERTIRARVEGATQLAAADYGPLAAALERMRPDRVFVDDLLAGPGPLGSREEVRLVLDLALSGKRVVAAIEAPDPVAALARAAATGVDAGVLLAPARALVGVRLVKRVCPRCREDFEATPELAEELGLGELSTSRRLAIGIGCWECGGSGYRGRSALVEVLHVDDAIRERARLLDPRQVRSLAADRGARPLPEKALAALRAGLTSVGQAEPIIAEW
jgi:type II secretory ATPase GspE/PulE/Tfp pilus assembly ATPase PilB-like protein